jgi:hypothetical protein
MKNIKTIIISCPKMKIWLQKNIIFLKLMKIQILSGNYCAFPIQSNRCYLRAQMLKAFLRGLNSNFLILRYVFWRALERASKTGVNSFSQKNRFTTL